MRPQPTVTHRGSLGISRPTKGDALLTMAYGLAATPVVIWVCRELVTFFARL